MKASPRVTVASTRRTLLEVRFILCSSLRVPCPIVKRTRTTRRGKADRDPKVRSPPVPDRTDGRSGARRSIVDGFSSSARDFAATATEPARGVAPVDEAGALTASGAIVSQPVEARPWSCWPVAASLFRALPQLAPSAGPPHVSRGRRAPQAARPRRFRGLPLRRRRDVWRSRTCRSYDRRERVSPAAGGWTCSPRRVRGLSHPLVDELGESRCPSRRVTE
jgi:hypothetical protein